MVSAYPIQVSLLIAMVSQLSLWATLIAVDKASNVYAVVGLIAATLALPMAIIVASYGVLVCLAAIMLAWIYLLIARGLPSGIILAALVSSLIGVALCSLSIL